MNRRDFLKSCIAVSGVVAPLSQVLGIRKANSVVEASAPVESFVGPDDWVWVTLRHDYGERRGQALFECASRQCRSREIPETVRELAGYMSTQRPVVNMSVSVERLEQSGWVAVGPPKIKAEFV